METTEVAVVVVGAGVAGLAAGAALAEKGCRVLVLETQARAGGRIRTIWAPGWPLPVELGAEFVHARPAFFSKALRRAGRTAEPHVGEHVLARAGDVRRANQVWQEAFALIERLPDEDISYETAVQPAGAASAAGDVARDDGRGFSRSDVMTFARAYVEGFNAAEAGRISSRGLVLQNHADRDYQGGRIERVLGGYDGLVDWLAERLLARGGRLALRTHVDEIDWRQPDVLIRCRSGFSDESAQVRCRAAIVTVPVTMLRADSPSAPRFLPQLPADKREAAQGIALGAVTKLVLRFRREMWDRSVLHDLSFVHTPDAVVPTWWVPRPLDVPVLVGWAAGPASTRFSGQHGGDLQRAVHAAVTGLGKAVGSPEHALLGAIDDALFVDWAADPAVRGAYSWLPVGTLDAPAALATPVEGRLFFAGEATHTGFQMGTVHGAMETGLRAAAEVLRVAAVTGSATGEARTRLSRASRRPGARPR